MLPALELSQSMIDNPALSGYAQVYLHGAMVLSHKPQVWDEFLQTLTSVHLMETVGVVPSTRRMLDAEMGEIFWRVRGEAMPTRYWTGDQPGGKALKRGFEGGFLAGMVYYTAIQQFIQTRQFSLEDIKAAALTLARETFRIKVHHAKLEGALKKHRRVGHLWASFVHVCDELGGRDLPFPYGPGGLHDFLFKALWYQEWGSRICPYGNPPLFPVNEMLRVPAGLKLNTKLAGLIDGDGLSFYPLPSVYLPGDLPPMLVAERPTRP